ncbi:DUF6082 family protein [Dactylosporangium sp. CA-233914]|uniref:DUF6082 family protein n=1 Tax=Dactylosporangium sp. CA-233914 TaxID=3239934 RepID=UPI003D8D3E10
MDRTPAGRSAPVRLLVLAGFGLAALLAAGVLGLASIGAAELATGTQAPRGWDQLSDAFSVVNGIFSVFALIVVGATLWVQYNELRMQRAELRMQREAAEQSRHELFRSSEVAMRELHVHLTELAMNDPDLAEVWGGYGDPIEPRRRKQFFFANLMLNNLNLIHRIGDRDESYVRAAVRDAFTNPIVREFWASVRDYRREIRPPGSPAGDFDALVEDVYREVCARLG